MKAYQKPPWDDGPAALIAYFTAAIQQEPDNARMYYERGRCRAAVDDHVGALADLAEALRRDPDMAWAHYQRGLVRESQGDLTGAAGDFRQALDTRVRASGWQFSLALARVELARGNTVQVARALDDVLREQPQEANAFYLRGELRRRQGDLPAALADFDRALQIDPQHELAQRGRRAVQNKIEL